ncbi:ankyrin repeat-containing domain protein [Amylocarpus encephaloides]|uniref:Ankyrin repeat-containing domain protein n=1 Tax=Amylocarpus encephaloides TaxID=45428 RepID=A0A9P7YQ36_9HELO|nr:ankyrin repeat-containing domain protein [Amylocarpus encephaloides]
MGKAYRARTRRTSLDTLPWEILLQIFAYRFTTDTGTHTSLIHVNKRCYTILNVEIYSTNIREFKGVGLLRAIKLNSLSAVHKFLLNGANPNQPHGSDASPLTPLNIAARQGNHAIFKALLNAGANPDGTSTSRWSPLYEAIACRREGIAKLIVQRFPDVNSCYVSQVNKITPLHMTAALGMSGMVKWLLERGIEVDAKTMCRKSTALWDAIQGPGDFTYPDMDLKKFRKDDEVLETIKLLMRYQADPDIEFYESRYTTTPRVMAASHKDPRVKSLFEEGMIQITRKWMEPLFPGDIVQDEDEFLGWEEPTREVPSIDDGNAFPGLGNTPTLPVRAKSVAKSAWGPKQGEAFPSLSDPYKASIKPTQIGEQPHGIGESASKQVNVNAWSKIGTVSNGASSSGNVSQASPKLKGKRKARGWQPLNIR